MSRLETFNAVSERRLEYADYAAAGVVPGMKGVRGYVFKGPVRTAYLARCNTSAHYHAGWWVQDDKSNTLIRTEKAGRKLAMALASCTAALP